jgi:hypothetical protein
LSLVVLWRLALEVRCICFHQIEIASDDRERGASRLLDDFASRSFSHDGEQLPFFCLFLFLFAVPASNPSFPILFPNSVAATCRHSRRRPRSRSAGSTSKFSSASKKSFQRLTLTPCSQSHRRSPKRNFNKLKRIESHVPRRKRK